MSFSGGWLEVRRVSPPIFSNSTQNKLMPTKERARHGFVADENFEADWILGWNNQQNVVDDISKLKVNSPNERKLQKTETCSISGEMNGLRLP
jgi:hypothetical protein